MKFFDQMLCNPRKAISDHLLRNGSSGSELFCDDFSTFKAETFALLKNFTYKIARFRIVMLILEPLRLSAKKLRHDRNCKIVIKKIQGTMEYLGIK